VTCHQQAASPVHYTTSCKQSSAPEDGRNYRPKHVELIEITNRLLLWYNAPTMLPGGDMSPAGSITGALHHKL